MNDLVIKISGEIVESNFDGWKEAALAKIDEAASRELVTDEDFAWAEGMVKECESLEKAIKKAKEDAINQTADIRALFAAMDAVDERLSNFRLAKGKQIRIKKEQLKNDVLNSAIDEVKKAINEAVSGSIFAPSDIEINRTVITAATANKKSIDGMKKSVRVVVNAEIQRICESVDLARENVVKMETVEMEYPGIFGDKKVLAWKAAGELAAIIESRISNFKLQAKEKADREAALSQQTVNESVHAIETSGIQVHETTESEQPEQREEKPAEESAPVALLFTVELLCSVPVAQDLARQFDTFFGGNAAVKKMNLARK